MLASLALSALTCRKGARSLAPVAWAFVVSSLWLAGQASGLGWFAAPSLALLGALCVTALIDARYFVLPDGPLIMLAFIGLAMRLTGSVGDFTSCLAAALFAFALFRVVAWLFEKWRGVPGLGQGDARLFAIAGLWLGWSGLPSCLLIASLSAALAAAIALSDGGLASHRDPLPFGPHLALGLWLVWSIGPLALA